MPRESLSSLAALLLLPCALYSQTDNTATISGYAKSTFNGRPLAGVMISVAGTRQFAVTDSTGTFRLSGLPVGRQLIHISYLDRETEAYEFELRRGKTKRLAVMLDVEAVDLAPVVVTVRHRDGWRDLAGFYERRRFYGGWGRFYTREDIVRHGFRSVGDVLRRMGIYTRCVDAGCVPTKRMYGTLCPVTVAVDGMAFYAHEYESVLIDDVRGVEMYGGLIGAPPTLPVYPLATPFFNTESGLDDMRYGRQYGFEGTSRRCSGGTVAIWTR